MTIRLHDSRAASRRILRPRTTSFATLLLALATAGTTACGSPAPKEESTRGTTSGLNVIVPGNPPPPGAPEDAAQVICSIINDIPSMSIGDVNISAGACTTHQYQNLYYLGSDSYSGRLAGPAPPARAQAMTDALYCALSGSNGATANGTISGGGLGSFGMSSRIVVSQSNPSTMQVSGQRIGTLWAFGAGLDIEDQDYVVQFPTETQAQGLIHTSGGTTGRYMNLQTSTVGWSIGGSGSLPPFTLGLSFGQNPYFQSMNDNLVAILGDAYSNAANPALSWSAWTGMCSQTCTSFICYSCPDAAETAQYQAFASYTAAQYDNLTDGVLPYVGDTGGISGNYVYANSSLNWTMFGPAPGGLVPNYETIYGPVVAGDPTNTVMSNPSTYIKFDFGLDYDIISLMLNLDIDFASGMELTQGEIPSDDTAPAEATVVNKLSAESGVSLTANLSIANPFGFGPNPLLQETFTLFDPNPAAQTTTAASMEYDETMGFPFYGYTSASGTASNPVTAEQACLAAPVVNNASVTPRAPRRGSRT